MQHTKKPGQVVVFRMDTPTLLLCLRIFQIFFPILNSFHSKIHKFMSLTMKKGVSQIISCRSNYYIDCDKLQNKNINKKPFRSMLISIYLRVCVRSHVDCTR